MLTPDKMRQPQPIHTSRPIDIAAPSWVAPMAALGMSAWKATGPRQLYDALRAWHPSDGPGYLEICFDADKCQHMCNDIR